MESKTDSDKDVKIDGRIISLSRGILGKNGYVINEKSLVSLAIQSNTKSHLVDIPIKTESDLELIPYQSSLVGFNVEYSKEHKENHEGFREQWSLKILSGKLKGNIYNFNRYI